LAEEGELPEWLKRVALEDGFLRDPSDKTDTAEIAEIPGPPGEEAPVVEAPETQIVDPADAPEGGGADEALETPEWLQLLQREGVTQFTMSGEPEGQGDGDAAVILDESTTSDEEELEVPAWLQILRQDQGEEPDAEPVAEESGAPPEAEAEVVTEPPPDASAETDQPAQDDVPQESAEESIVEEPESAPEPPAEVDLGHLFPGEAVDQATLDQYEDTLKEEPNDHATRWALVQAHAKLGDHEEAIGHAKQLVESGEYVSEISTYLEAVVAGGAATRQAYQVLGDAYFKQELLPQALNAYRQALAMLD
jgi:hypothetical protein